MCRSMCYVWEKFPDISLICLEKSNSLIFSDLEFFPHKIPWFPWYSSSAGSRLIIIYIGHVMEMQLSCYPVLLPCHQLIAKSGNKTNALPYLNPYVYKHVQK